MEDAAVGNIVETGGILVTDKLNNELLITLLSYKFA
jgi:hypothetical protein